MNKPKFKVGDKVVFKDIGDGRYLKNFKVGGVYTVTEYQSFQNSDMDLVSFKEPDVCLWAKRFDLYEEDDVIREGDTVECVQKPSNAFRITVGKQYKVLQVKQNTIEINSDTTHQGGNTQFILKRRFKKVKSNEIKQMNKKIVIRTGNNPILREMFQKLAIDAGFAWPTGKRVESFTFYYLHLRKDDKSLLMTHSCDGTFAGGNADSITYDGVKEFEQAINAIKELGKPDVIAPIVIAGYQSKYIKHELFINFGCANISIKMLNNYLELMEKKSDCGNREVCGITFYSGVSLGMSEIKKILDYVKEVNNS